MKPTSTNVYTDPYLTWTVRTGFAGHEAAVADRRAPIPVLIEATAAQQEALANKVVISTSAQEPASRFFTAMVARSRLAEIDALVESMEFALPLATGPKGRTKAVKPADADLVLAVIDRGCAFLNASFCAEERSASDKGRPSRKTRLISLWDQGRLPDKHSPWRRPGSFGYGRELDREAIDRQLARLVAPMPVTEAHVYEELDYLLDGFDRVRDSAHGTHVLDTAGGSVDANPPRSSAKPLHRDAAARAPLIFVDVPELGPGDTTGASPGVFLIDALHFIRQRAGKAAQVVVNISLGAFAGPHDGTSIVERAIDDFIEQDGRISVTVAAGNSARERWHASGELAPGSCTELNWRTMPEDKTDSFLEIWFATSAKGRRDGGRNANKIEIQVSPPRGQPTPWLEARGLTDITDLEGRLIGAVIGRDPKTGDRDGMFLIATMPTAGVRAAAAPGLWRIALRNAGSESPARVDAWIQRDEPAWSAAPSVQSFFQSASGGFIVGGQAGGLSSLATGRETIVVGAASVEGSRLARYSSTPGQPRIPGASTRRVDAMAYADESQTAIGLIATGVLSFSRVRMGGTSVAAPAAARQIYNALVDANHDDRARGRACELGPVRALAERIRSAFLHRKGQPSGTASRDAASPPELLDAAHRIRL